jgi:hypothetical protein
MNGEQQQPHPAQGQRLADEITDGAFEDALLLARWAE